MKLDLVSITLENFGSFKSQEVFKIPSRPGLYHLQGVNQVDPRLTGNGTGKSTVWKGLFWNLFEQTPDGLKAGDVCNWEVDKGSSVTLDFFEETDAGPITWTMKRNWKPNSWTLSHVAEFVTDDEVIDLAKGFPNWLTDQLPRSPDVFLNCILMAQEAPTFLDLKPEAQATLFGEVLNLDHWLELSRKASAKSSDQDRSNRALEATVARLEGAVEHQPDYRAKIKEWDEAQDRKLDKAKAEYQKLLDEYDKVKMFKVRVVSLDARKELAERDARLKELVAEEREAQRRLSDAEAEARSIGRRADEMLAEANHLRDHDTCPTCEQPIKSTRVVDALVRRAEAVKGEAHGVRDQIDQQEGILFDLGKQIEVERREIDKLEESIRDSDGATLQRSRQLTDLNRRLDQLEDEYDALRNEVNPWVTAQKEAQGRARINQEALLKARKGLDRGYELFSLYSYWIKGFKELRLYHIAQALHELEIEVNNSLVELGLPGWEIRFEVDRENKKGSIQRGFSVRVVSPHTSKSVPWRAWSGGEKQRLRIAASMGMANMIRGRMPRTIALEVWDEPTKGMSRQGVQDLMTALARRARFEQRVIIVVDHTAPDFGDFAGRATIIKTDQGSRIETDW